MINTLTLVGWVFLVASWVVPHMMRKRALTFEERQQSYGVGVFLAAIALVCFVSNIIVYYAK
jgi:hypothetical protein